MDFIEKDYEGEAKPVEKQEGGYVDSGNEGGSEEPPKKESSGGSFFGDLLDGFGL